MTEMALRSRIAVLVVVALLAVAGAFSTAAFVAADEAKAGTPLGTPYTPVPSGICQYFKTC